MVRHCVVKDCNSDSRYHPSTKFFKFPGSLRKTECRKQWITNIHRKKNDRGIWEPKPEDVVCDKHFVEGKPTDKYPVPQLAMGHKFVKRVTGRCSMRKITTKTSQIKMKEPQQEKRDVSTNQQCQSPVETPQMLSTIDVTQDSKKAPNDDMGSEPILDKGANVVPPPETTGHAEIYMPETLLPSPGKPDVHDLPDTLGEDTEPDLICHLFTHDEDLSFSSPVPFLSFHSYAKPPTDDPMYISDQESSIKFESDNVRENSDSEIERLRQEVRNLKGRLSVAQKQLSQVTHNPQFSYKMIVGDDEKTRQFTGFPSYKCFKTIFEKRIKPRAELLSLNHHHSNQPWHKGAYTRKPGPERQLVLIDEFFLVMMRLRLGLIEADLAARFDLKKQQVSRIIGKWLPCLARCLRKCVKMPPKEQVKMHMPKVFRAYPHTRVIIDCTEVFIERPTTLLAHQQTWSTYKNHNTAKALVGISPDGGITFLSKMWGGRASDKHIVKNSGFLETLEPYDQVMADRGFDIAAELAELSCTLNIPPFTKGKSQLSRTEVGKHRKISSLRIHVERAIERLKNFRILQGVFPLSHVHMLDDILIVCGAVVNLWPPIVPN